MPVRPDLSAMRPEPAVMRAEPVEGHAADSDELSPHHRRRPEAPAVGFDELSPQQPGGPAFDFVPNTLLPGGLGRSGVITTPHGTIRTPAFVAVGTKATVKAVLPESVAALGAQAVLANAYHLYLQPGADLINAAGGLGRFRGGRLDRGRARRGGE